MKCNFDISIDENVNRFYTVCAIKRILPAASYLFSYTPIARDFPCNICKFIHLLRPLLFGYNFFINNVDCLPFYPSPLILWLFSKYILEINWNYFLTSLDLVSFCQFYRYFSILYLAPDSTAYKLPVNLFLVNRLVDKIEIMILLPLKLLDMSYLHLHF